MFKLAILSSYAALTAAAEMPEGHPRVPRELSTEPGFIPTTAMCPYKGENRGWISEKSWNNYEPVTSVPPASVWEGATQEILEQVLSEAEILDNVEDSAVEGQELEDLKEITERILDDLQTRQFSADTHGIGHPCLHRAVHAQTLYGGEVDLHLNPAFTALFDVWDRSSLGGIMRVSNALQRLNLDESDFFGMAIELVGTNDAVTNILLLGGDERLEASRPNDPFQQLWAFNLLDSPNSVGASWDLLRNVGAIETPLLLAAVVNGKTTPNSLVQNDPDGNTMHFWSRTVYRLPSKVPGGPTYLVKMRAAPVEISPEAKVPKGEDQTIAEHLIEEMATRVRTSEVTWNFDMQFMKPGDSIDKTSDKWSGNWYTVGQLKTPLITPETESRAQSFLDIVLTAKFDIWKDKTNPESNPDAKILEPHGIANQARRFAYAKTNGNRGKENPNPQIDNLSRAVAVAEGNGIAIGATAGASGMLVFGLVVLAVVKKFRASKPLVVESTNSFVGVPPLENIDMKA